MLRTASLHGQLGQLRLAPPTADAHAPSRRMLISTKATHSATPYDLRRELSNAVRRQAARQLAKLREELVDPWLLPAPAPLTDTLPPSHLADPDSRFILVDGVRVHYKQIGSDTLQPAVLLLHGFNGSTFNFRDVMEGISQSGAGSEGRRVIAFDRPPFGLTERPLRWEGGAERDPYTCEGGARLAAGLLDALGVESAVVVGHSMGAVVAMELLKLHPEKVAALGLVAPALPSRPDAFRRAMTAGQQLQALARLALLRSDTAGLNYIRKTLRERAAEVQAGQLQVHHAGRLARQEIIDGYLRPMKADNWDRGSLLGFRAISFSQELPAYDSIKQPVLVVQGRQDTTILTSTAQQIVERLRSRSNCITQYEEIDACGHIPMEEFPDKFIGAMAKLLTAVQGTDGTSVASGGSAVEELTAVADTLPAATVGIAEVEAV